MVNRPTNPKLYARIKSLTKKKFKVYPSAYANAYLVKTYKKKVADIELLKSNG